MDNQARRRLDESFTPLVYNHPIVHAAMEHYHYCHCTREEALMLAVTALVRENEELWKHAKTLFRSSALPANTPFTVWEGLIYGKSTCPAETPGTEAKAARADQKSPP